ncbi:hypothetical protein Q5P01_017843 [Channa striata]|uniref:Uncharacterized protein n=1 Tax=Channa striata TaxID=64152 RepID=A0AA88MBK1_CHASR|nr:hypothetical protein Q5P01_017843 [Channa striata]
MAASQDILRVLNLSAFNKDCLTRKTLLQTAVENCREETVLQWLRENSKKETFSKLVDMFDYFQKHIDEEEKKNHSNSVDITFMAHGSISLPMIPACCLLPLSSITDVLLHAPWNCVILGDVTYGVATGKIQPQHRKFYCSKKDSCQIPDEKHLPTNLPDYWNSMRRAGGQKVPTITLSPVKPPEDGFWKRYESLKEKHGPPGRNHIIIPFIVPGNTSQSVLLCVVTLALSLVLLKSRFKATVHLCACLSKSSAETKLDKDHLQQQYSYAIDNTGMKVSADMFSSASTTVQKETPAQNGCKVV